MEKEMICICCPRGCHILVNDQGIFNYSCPRGLQYAKDELTHPKRVLTTSVKIKNPIDIYVVPCKSDKPLPKEMIFDVLKEINKVELTRPIAMHQIVIENVLNTGVNVVTTKEIK